MAYFNNDISHPIWDRHNQGHLIGVAILTAIPFIPWWIGIALFTLWEIGDGFKPWYYEYTPTGHKLWDLFRRECLYSNKFSLQDFFIWNMAGFGWGIIIRYVIKLTGI